MNSTIQIPHIKVDTNYVANTDFIKFLPLYGNGTVSVFLKNIELLVLGKVNITNGLSISNSNISFSVDDTTFDLQGLLDDEVFSHILSLTLTEIVAPFIKENREEISQIISPIAEKIINAILKGDSKSTDLVKLSEAINIDAMKLLEFKKRQ